MTLCCFTVASLAVELLFDKPGWFAFGLALATFSMTMLGAVNQRYATIASATLILAIYTMISSNIAATRLWAMSGASLPCWLSARPGMARSRLSGAPSSRVSP